MLNDEEQNKYDVIGSIIKGEKTRKEAVYELHLSSRQIDRLKKAYKKGGEIEFIHKNRGKQPHNKKDHLIIAELKKLYLSEYYDYNIKAFYEELTENEKYKGKYDVSYSTLYNAFLSDDIISPIAHKETIKLYNERMNNAINDNKNLQFVLKTKFSKNSHC